MDEASGTGSRLRYKKELQPATGAGCSQNNGVAGTVSGQANSGESGKTILTMPRCGTMELVGYTLPELHTNPSGWYIDYYVFHPITRKRERKRIRLNKGKDLHARRLFARENIRELTLKLQSGWNPFHEQDLPQAGVTLADALDQWDRVKTRQLRHSSPYSYTSFTSVFRNWCAEAGILQNHASAFNRSHAISFLAHVSDVRLVGNVTYNNYLVHFIMLFKWMIERGMRSENPFEKFARRKEAQKTRTYLTDEDRIEMAEWIKKNNPNFWLACMFIYGTLIRPGELRRLHVSDVDLVRQVVQLPAHVTKSGKERTPAIPDWMVRELLAMGFDKQPGKAWLIGNELRPDEKQLTRNKLNGHWVKMRKKLKWTDAKQLYSLRDTGIIQLLRDGVDLLHVRQQAGHEDIDTTNSYLKHAFPNGPQEIKEKGTSLQASSPIVMGMPMFNGLAIVNKQEPRFQNLER